MPSLVYAFSHHRNEIHPPQIQLETISLVEPCRGDAEVHLAEVFERSQMVVLETPSRSVGKSTDPT